MVVGRRSIKFPLAGRLGDWIVPKEFTLPAAPTISRRDWHGFFRSNFHIGAKVARVGKDVKIRNYEGDGTVPRVSNAALSG
jgi:hypothetical protein